MEYASNLESQRKKVSCKMFSGFPKGYSFHVEIGVNSVYPSTKFLQLFPNWQFVVQHNGFASSTNEKNTDEKRGMEVDVDKNFPVDLIKQMAKSTLIRTSKSLKTFLFTSRVKVSFVIRKEFFLSNGP